MAEITKEQFKVVGKNTKTMESISRPNIGYWQDAWRRIRKNKIAFFSLCLIGLYVLMAIFVPMFSTECGRDEPELFKSTLVWNRLSWT